MKLRRYLQIGLALLVLGVLYETFFNSKGSLKSTIRPEVFREQIKTARQKKDIFYRTNADSPIPDKAGFKGLVYFDPDLAYRVTARLEPFADKTQKMVIRLSDGSEEVYEKFAHVVFTLGGTLCRLLVVKHEGTLSILYKDATSGHKTYGGGRYIDLTPESVVENQVVVDFNEAYNPYCAYNPQYACPLPPAENTLPVAVNAGERYVAHE